MVSIPVYNVVGERTGDVDIDDALLGGRVRPHLLKQAIVTYLDHQRHHSAHTRSRGMVTGSTRKLYRQKGTGRARMGMARMPIRRGGGVTFAKKAPFPRKRLPRSLRSLAWKNAILAKIKTNDALILDDFVCERPQTNTLAKTLSRVGVEAGCLLAIPAIDRAVYLSGRNIPKTEVRPISQLNAYEILRRRKLVFTKPAFDVLKESLEA